MMRVRQALAELRDERAGVNLGQVLGLDPVDLHGALAELIGAEVEAPGHAPDAAQLLLGQPVAVGCASGVSVMAVPIAIPVAVDLVLGRTVAGGLGGSLGGVEVQADTEQAGRLLQRIGGGGLEVVSDGDHLALAAHGDRRATEAHLGHTVCDELAEHDHLGLAHVVLDDLEAPVALEGVVEASDVGAALHVAEAVAERTFPGPEQLVGERLLENVAVHWRLLAVASLLQVDGGRLGVGRSRW